MLTAHRVVVVRSGDVEIRWVSYRCVSPICLVPHNAGLASLAGTDRWAIVALAPVEEEVMRLVEEAVDEHGIAHSCAAFGIPWRLIDGQQIELQAGLLVHGGLGREGEAELVAQTPRQLLALRQVVGIDVSRMAPVLSMLGRYRRNVGGELADIGQEGFPWS